MSVSSGIKLMDGHSRNCGSYPVRKKESITGLYLEPDESSSHSKILFISDPFSYYPTLQPELQKILIFQIPKLMHIFCTLGHSKEYIKLH
jgi:hypothetical protein